MRGVLSHDGASYLTKDKYTAGEGAKNIFNTKMWMFRGLIMRK